MSQENLLERMCLYPGVNQQFFDFFEADVLLGTLRQINTFLYHELPNHIHAIILTNPNIIEAYIMKHQNSPCLYRNVRQIKLISDIEIGTPSNCLSLSITEQYFPLLRFLKLHKIQFKTLQISPQIPLSHLEMSKLSITQAVYLPPAQTLVSLLLDGIAQKVLLHLFRLSPGPYQLQVLKRIVEKQTQQEIKEGEEEEEKQEQKIKEEEEEKQEQKIKEEEKVMKEDEETIEGSLKSLFITSLYLFKIKNVIQQTLDRCKSLEKLTIEKCHWSGPIFIRYKSLKHLKYSKFISTSSSYSPSSSSIPPPLVVYYSKQLESFDLEYNNNIRFDDQQEIQEENQQENCWNMIFPKLTSASFKETEYFSKLLQNCKTHSILTQVFPSLMELSLEISSMNYFTQIILPSIPHIKQLKIRYSQNSISEKEITIRSSTLRDIFISFKSNSKGISTIIQIRDCPNLEKVHVCYLKQLFLHNLPQLKDLLLDSTDTHFEIHCDASIVVQLKKFGCLLTMNNKGNSKKTRNKKKLETTKIQEDMTRIQSFVQQMRNLEALTFTVNNLSACDFQECWKTIVLIEQDLHKLISLKLVFLDGKSYEISRLTNIRHLEVVLTTSHNLIISDCPQLQTLCVSTDIRNEFALILKHLPVLSMCNLMTFSNYVTNLAQIPYFIFLQMSQLPQLSTFRYPFTNLLCLSSLLDTSISSTIRTQIETEAQIYIKNILQRRIKSVNNEKNEEEESEEDSEEENEQSEEEENESEQEDNEEEIESEQEDNEEEIESEQEDNEEEIEGEQEDNEEEIGSE